MVEIISAAGIERIGRAIGSMDGMTRQDSALVEEASAAAESLSDQAAQVDAVLAVFRREARAQMVVLRARRRSTPTSASAECVLRDDYST
jgi:hypothetical protein